MTFTMRVLLLTTLALCVSNCKSSGKSVEESTVQKLGHSKDTRGAAALGAGKILKEHLRVGKTLQDHFAKKVGNNLRLCFGLAGGAEDGKYMAYVVSKPKRCRRINSRVHGIVFGSKIGTRSRRGSNGRVKPKQMTIRNVPVGDTSFVAERPPEGFPSPHMVRNLLSLCSGPYERSCFFGVDGNNRLVVKLRR